MVGKASLSGLCPVLSVPFSSDGSQVDVDSFERLLEYFLPLEKSLGGLVLFGVASEFYKLEDCEKRELALRFSQAFPSSSIKKFVSITDHSTELAVRQATRYSQLDIDGLMLLPPYFLNPHKEAILEHIHAVAQATTLPIMLQYAPNETGSRFTVEDFSALLDAKSDLILKIESTPPMDDIKKVLQHHPGVSILNGYAGLYMLEAFKMGAVGVMPGCSFVEIYAKTLALMATGRAAEARTLHHKLLRYLKLWMTRVERIIAVEKRILARRGIIASEYCRKPTHLLSDEDRIDEFFEEFSEHLI